MSYGFIQVGTGGQGARWCRDFLPPNVEEELIEPVAAADVDEDALENAREGLGLARKRCYTDAEEAIAAHADEADFCTVVVPPWVHEEVVDAATAHDLHVLSEKPIADALDASARIARTVADAGVKMGVTMSHRFDRDKTTLREAMASGEYGPVDYLVCRFTCNARKYGTWGAFRHEMADPLLVEGGVHHLDILADLAAAVERAPGPDYSGDVARCEHLTAETWTPEWGDFGGPAQALATMRFANGVRATYEGAKTNARRLNGWGHEYVRAECREATLVLDGREVRAYEHDPDGATIGGSLAADERDGERRGEVIEPAGPADAKWSNTLLIQRFVEWLDGGEPMATAVEDNLQSMALVEAAIEAGDTGEVRNPQAMLAEARTRAEE